MTSLQPAYCNDSNTAVFNNPDWRRIGDFVTENVVHYNCNFEQNSVSDWQPVQFFYSDRGMAMSEV